MVISDLVSTNIFSSFVYAILSLLDHNKVTGILNLCLSSCILALFLEGSESSCCYSWPRFHFIAREYDEGKTLEELTEKLSTKESSQAISVICSSTFAPTGFPARTILTTHCSCKFDISMVVVGWCYMLGYITCTTMQALKTHFNGGCSLLIEVLYQCWSQVNHVLIIAFSYGQGLSSTRFY